MYMLWMYIYNDCIWYECILINGIESAVLLLLLILILFFF